MSENAQHLHWSAVHTWPVGYLLSICTLYVLMGDGLFTMTPGHKSLETDELEERTNKQKNCELSREKLMQ